MVTPLLLGEPYKSADEASKAKRSALLGLCLVMVVQAAAILFIWWISKFDNSISNLDISMPYFDVLFLFILAVLLYFYNSRILAGALLAFAAFGLASTWWVKVSVTGSFLPPGMALVLAAVAAQVAIAVFKTHELQKTDSAKPRRSGWVTAALIATFLLILAGFLVPPLDFLIHTRYKVTLTDNGSVITYYEPMDKYSLEYPKSWLFEHPAMEYGNVIFSQSDNSNVTVKVERWQPWSIAPVKLVNADAFLKMAQDEAATYSRENDLAVDRVELLPSKVNKARVVYSGADGSKKYVYYIYDKAWSRQTSDAAYYFWRLTADVPKEGLKYDAEVKSILDSFAINQ